MREAHGLEGGLVLGKCWLLNVTVRCIFFPGPSQKAKSPEEDREAADQAVRVEVLWDHQSGPYG